MNTDLIEEAAFRIADDVLLGDFRRPLAAWLNGVSVRKATGYVSEREAESAAGIAYAYMEQVNRAKVNQG